MTKETKKSIEEQKQKKYQKAEAALNITLKTFRKQMKVYINYNLPKTADLNEKEDMVEEVVETFRDEAQTIVFNR